MQTKRCRTKSASAAPFRKRWTKQRNAILINHCIYSLQGTADMEPGRSMPLNLPQPPPPVERSRVLSVLLGRNRYTGVDLRESHTERPRIEPRTQSLSPIAESDAVSSELTLPELREQADALLQLVKGLEKRAMECEAADEEDVQETKAAAIADALAKRAVRSAVQATHAEAEDAAAISDSRARALHILLGRSAGQPAAVTKAQAVTPTPSSPIAASSSSTNYISEANSSISNEGSPTSVMCLGSQSANRNAAKLATAANSGSSQQPIDRPGPVRARHAWFRLQEQVLRVPDGRGSVGVRPLCRTGDGTTQASVACSANVRAASASDAPLPTIPPTARRGLFDDVKTTEMPTASEAKQALASVQTTSPCVLTADVQTQTTAPTTEAENAFDPPPMLGEAALAASQVMSSTHRPDLAARDAPSSVDVHPLSPACVSGRDAERGLGLPTAPTVWAGEVHPAMYSTTRANLAVVDACAHPHDASPSHSPCHSRNSPLQSSRNSSSDSLAQLSRCASKLNLSGARLYTNDLSPGDLLEVLQEAADMERPMRRQPRTGSAPVYGMKGWSVGG